MGVNEVDNKFLSNSAYNDYILDEYTAQIQQQARALAARIRANCAEGHTDECNDAAEEIENEVGIQNGHLQGGNYNFPTDLVSDDLSCDGASRCNGIHLAGGGFVHLDTANPLSGAWGLFLHASVDVLGGNTIWTVIPR